MHSVMVDTSDSEVLLRFETISLSESLVTKKEKQEKKKNKWEFVNTKAGW